MIKKIVLVIVSLFLFLINTSVQAADNIITKEITAQANDGFNLKAFLSYPEVKGQKEYSTVVLLHSLGYDSQWWGSLPDELLNKGYAVFAIDLRGHGESIYNLKSAKVSWRKLKILDYAKYPEDVLRTIGAVHDENPECNFFNNWAIVGSDIGAAAGILAANRTIQRPKTIVMISPEVSPKGLFVPPDITQLEDVDFLAITGTDDADSAEAALYLKKFAPNEYTEFTSKSKTKGMLILENDEALSKMISEWISEYLN